MFDNTQLVDAPDALKIQILSSINTTLGINISSTTCLITRPDVLQRQGITTLSKWNCLWVTLASGFFFRILFYLAFLLGKLQQEQEEATN